MLPRRNQNKRKRVAQHITHLMCSLVLLLTVSLELVASYSHSRGLLSLLVLLSLLHSYICKYTEIMSRKFRKISRIWREEVWRFWKRSLFFLNPKMTAKTCSGLRARKVDWSYFVNNAAKTCLYGLKISENTEIEHAFQSKSFFHLSSNLHKICLSDFKKCLGKKDVKY